MKILVGLVLLWLAVLIAGAVFGVIGKVIWIAVLGTVFAALYSYFKNKDLPEKTTDDGF